MNEKILFVDDDVNILQAYKRQLRKAFDLHTAQGPEEGLKRVSGGDSFAVVISDFSMPGMNGVEFLSEVKKRSPDSVRIMLTGFANATNAINAINEGNIFRFLAKPCPPEQLAPSLQAGIEQYRLITAEKELLEKTLFGSVRVLSQILSIVNPTAFSSTSRIKFYMKHLVAELGLPDGWRFELAAMLCQLGCITLPPDTLSKIMTDQQLTAQEIKVFDAHPSIAADLLKNIPRLEAISAMIKLQHCVYSDHPVAGNKLPEDATVLGGHMLHVALDFDHLAGRNRVASTALEIMRERKGLYHPLILDAMSTVESVERKMELRTLMIKNIQVTMISDEEIKTKGGLLLMARGQEVTKPTLDRLRSFAQTTGIKEPVRMKVPV